MPEDQEADGKSSRQVNDKQEKINLNEFFHSNMLKQAVAKRPNEIVEACAGLGYHYIATLKEDFFSENHLVARRGSKYVLKISRFRFAGASLLGFVTGYLADREVRNYRAVEGIAGIPEITDRVGNTGFLHRYVEGETLKQVRREAQQLGQVTSRLHEDFFVRLSCIIAEMHRRNIAYVDLAKGENIIVAADGTPALIDFQLSFRPHRLKILTAPIFRALAAADRYHLVKHKNRFQPHLLTEDERKRLSRPALVRCYGVLAGPLLRLKRTVYPKGSNEVRSQGSGFRGQGHRA